MLTRALFLVHDFQIQTGEVVARFGTVTPRHPPFCFVTGLATGQPPALPVERFGRSPPLSGLRAGLRRVNDDDALTLLELSDQVVAVERGQPGYGDGDEEPEPRQPVALGEQLGWIEALPCKASRASCRRRLAGSQCFHNSQ